MIKKRLVNLLKNSKKYIKYNVIFQWIGLLSQITIVYSLTRIIGKAIYEDFVFEQIYIFLFLFLISLFIRIFCDRMTVRYSYKASYNVKRVLREKIYEKLLKLGTSYNEKISTAEVVQMTTEGVEQLEIYFGRYLPQLFYSLLAPVTLFVFLSFISFKVSLILLICVPLIPISIIVIQKIAKRLLSKYWGIYTSLGDSFLENLQGLTTLKIYKADEHRALKMDEEAQRFRRITMKVLIMQLNSISVMDIVAFGGASIGMVFAVVEMIKGNISFQNALMIILLASEFFIPLRLLGSFFHIAMNGMAACDKIFSLLDIEEVENGVEICDKDNMDIEFNDVSFSYENERDILKNVNIKIPFKKITALVGLSGCGKSTIANIICGKNKNYFGNILLGKKELKEIDEKNLMGNITLVSHNSYIFKGTVRENLLMANENLTDEQMLKALEKVNLLKFLNEEQGLYTKISEMGSNFSGGQRQRLAIARALLKNSSVYIFDEATSNIDAESESVIIKLIYQLSKEKTVILISHRLSNVIFSDNIYFIQNGKITEEGTHSMLYEKNGEYKKLYESQFELENYLGGYR